MAARQRVMQAKQAQMERVTNAVAGVMAAAERKRDAEAEIEAAEEQLRAEVDKLVKEGEGLEAIADMTEVDISVIRAARRPKGGDAPEPAAKPPRAPRAPRLAPVPNPPGDAAGEQAGDSGQGDGEQGQGATG